MHTGPQAVNNAVAIVPANFIVRRINAVDGAGEQVLRIATIHKSMLRPVAQHHYETCKQQWYYKNNQRGFQINETHQNTKKNKAQLASRKAAIQFFAPAVIKILERF